MLNFKSKNKIKWNSYMYRLSSTIYPNKQKAVIVERARGNIAIEKKIKWYLWCRAVVLFCGRRLRQQSCWHAPISSNYTHTHKKRRKIAMDFDWFRPTADNLFLLFYSSCWTNETNDIAVVGLKQSSVIAILRDFFIVCTSLVIFTITAQDVCNTSQFLSQMIKKPL